MLRRHALARISPYGALMHSAADIEDRKRAGVELRKMLVGMHVGKQMNAVDLAVLAHWHTLSGGCGLEDLAMRPGNDHLGNYAAHIALVLGKQLGDAQLYYADAPMFDRKASARTKVPVPIRLPSVAFHEHFAATAVDHSELGSPLPFDEPRSSCFQA